MANKPETLIQTKILEYLKKLKDSNEPLYYERRQAGGLSYKKGIPDIYCIYKFIHIEIEVKTPTGELSTMQEKFRDRCRKNGTPWICATSVNDVKDFIEKLKELLKDVDSII